MNFLYLKRCVRLLAASLAVAVTFVIVGCVDTEPENTRYMVTVETAGTYRLSRSGSGNYAAGEVVTIYAGIPPTRQYFKNWTTAHSGIFFSNENDAETKFTMPANDVVVTAKFEPLGTFTDNRDGKTYYKVKMPDGKTWMAENLNYQTGDSWCYDDEKSNCDKYGRLYAWNTAITVCPAGWHLSSRQEWDDLEAMLYAWNLRSTTWNISNNVKASLAARGCPGELCYPTDEFGFSALPGGVYLAEFNGIDVLGRIRFRTINESGYWWISTENGGEKTHYMVMSYYSTGMDVDYIDLNSGLNNLTVMVGCSVRCVQD